MKVKEFLEAVSPDCFSTEVPQQLYWVNMGGHSIITSWAENPANNPANNIKAWQAFLARDIKFAGEGRFRISYVEWNGVEGIDVFMYDDANDTWFGWECLDAFRSEHLVPVEMQSEADAAERALAAAEEEDARQEAKMYREHKIACELGKPSPYAEEFAQLAQRNEEDFRLSHAEEIKVIEAELAAERKGKK